MPPISIDDFKDCDGRQPAGVQPLPPGMAVGTSVVLRGRRWQLDATVTHADCRELHLSGPGPGNRRVLLWPFDRPAPAGGPPRLRAVRLRRWAVALTRLAATQIDPITPRASSRRVDIIPYQLSPALAMAGGAPRVLLADEVGLGKTIQAAWIVADLVARDPGARVLLAVPAGLRRQWARELSARFDIDTVAVDARWLRAAIADLPADVLPWTAPAVYVVSLDFLKRPDIPASVKAVVWDLVVVDEAHTATAPTDRHAALLGIAARARRVVTITATPYSGDPASFASLAALGSTGADSPPLMFRRSRQAIGDSRRRRHRFATVRITSDERRLQGMLERYSREVWNGAPEDQDGARLAVTILRKRALSSAAAAARSLRRRLELLQGRGVAPRQLSFLDEDEGGADDPQWAALGTPGLADLAAEHHWLASLIAAADAAATRESKQLFLLRCLRRVRGESAIVFTEYRDTLLQLASSLPPSLQLHGGLSAAERDDIQQRFNREGGLLLATDAAAEGLNLQGRCRFVINYELPWNPARLEQRIGRVDRIGQRRTVHALTLTARDTAEDLVIGNLARRLARVAAALGSDDQLAIFLDETRTARMVIGGAGIEEPYAPAAGTDGMFVRPGEDVAAAAAAADCLQRAHAADGTIGRSGGIAGIVVSSVRATAAIRRGFVVVIICSARTDEGALAAQQVAVVHLPGAPLKPASAAAARAAAAAVLASLPDVRALVPDLNGWFARTCSLHESIVRARSAREARLRDTPSFHPALQPGLFDPRAVDEASAASAADASVRGEHTRHLEALERTRPLRLACEPSAVLVVWG